MHSRSPVRVLLLLAVAILLLLFLIVGVVLTDTLLNIRHNLAQAPAWVNYLVVSGFALFSLFSGWLLLRLAVPKKKPAKADTVLPPLNESDLLNKLQRSKSSGIDTFEAERELRKLSERRAAGVIHVALFGEISSGKSSLIEALLPDAEVRISVQGGTTQTIDEYCWRSPAGDQLILTDMPGLNESALSQDAKARAEALRAHLVIYLLDGDLTRSQAQALEQLAALNKPMIVALNKTDRLSAQEITALKQQLQQRIARITQAEVVAISTGGVQQAIRILPDGREQAFDRKLPPQLDELKQSIQCTLDNNAEVLEQLRDSAVFSLINDQLDQAQARQRDEQAQQLVRDYAKKAVVMAVATMAPGSDILIQGYLATKMVKELCELYQVPVRKVDTELLLSLIQKHVRTHVTVLLAVAGNALKAFPGAGTLGGGVLHAIAYGFLFENLGKSLVLSLQTRGELHPLQVADTFEESLGENIKASAGFYTRLALKELRGKD